MQTGNCLSSISTQRRKALLRHASAHNTITCNILWDTHPRPRRTTPWKGQCYSCPAEWSLKYSMAITTENHPIFAGLDDDGNFGQIASLRHCWFHHWVPIGLARAMRIFNGNQRPGNKWMDTMERDRCLVLLAVLVGMCSFNIDFQDDFSRCGGVSCNKLGRRRRIIDVWEVPVLHF